MKIASLLLISGGKTAVIFELEEQILHEMALLVYMPVCRSGVPCIDTAGNDHDPASFFHPADKPVAVITFIGQNQLASQVKRPQQRLRHADIIAIPPGEQKTQWIPKPIRYRMDFRCQTAPARSGLKGFVPIHWLLSMHGTDCIHFATARIVPADPAMGFLYLANIGLH